MTSKMMMRLVAAVALSALVGAGCDDKETNGSADMAAQPDMAGGCVTNPQTATEILNACTDAQTGEATKDAPYFPSLAPGGVLPALP